MAVIRLRPNTRCLIVSVIISLIVCGLFADYTLGGVLPSSLTGDQVEKSSHSHLTIDGKLISNIIRFIMVLYVVGMRSDCKW